MSEQSNPTFQIPRDVIEPIIKAHVATAITNALGGQDRLVAEAIRQVLYTKVDTEGNPGRGYGSEVEFIQWMTRKVVANAVKETLEAEMAKHKDALKRAISDSLTKKNSPFIKQLAEGMV